MSNNSKRLKKIMLNSKELAQTINQQSTTEGTLLPLVLTKWYLYRWFNKNNGKERKHREKPLLTLEHKQGSAIKTCQSATYRNGTKWNWRLPQNDFFTPGGVDSSQNTYPEQHLRRKEWRATININNYNNWTQRVMHSSFSFISLNP